MNSEVINSVNYWDKLHKDLDRNNIIVDDWLEKYDNIILNCNTPIIDLGCGSGNDTLYLINKNKKVISCDQSINAINNINKNFPEIMDTKCFNMLDGLPFKDNYSDLIIADLCLHYFREKDTIKILKEIKRVLKNNGKLLFRLNSINDINHGAGTGLEIQPHLYLTDEGFLKRFFDQNDILYFFKDYEIEYLNEEVMTRYKLEKKLFNGCARVLK